MDQDGGNPHGGHRQRLRRTYLERRGEGMYDHQLLELLLTFSIPRQDTNPLAHRLMSRSAFGSLEGVLSADPMELMKIKGVGESTAVLLSLAGAMRGRAGSVNTRGERLNTPESAIRYCGTLDRGGGNENMYVVSLDKSYRVLHADRISIGTPGEVTVYPRSVVECALKYGAQNVILCHNHPSGDVAPSRDDYLATERIIQALGAVGIPLSDHIIIGGGSAFSMARESRMMDGKNTAPAATAAERKE